MLVGQPQRCCEEEFVTFRTTNKLLFLGDHLSAKLDVKALL